MQVNVPCLALIEDIDNVFHGRENVARKHGLMPMVLAAPKKGDGNGDGGDLGLRTPLTFDCLLNCLDGVERVGGIFTLVTTNDIGKVDAALGQPRKLPDGSVEFISQFQERCGQIALACFWRDKQAEQEEPALPGPSDAWFWDGDRCPKDREQYQRLTGVR
jgi:hypothetical protein